VRPVRGLRKWRRGRKLTARRRGEPKELNWGNCGSRRKLAATCRKVSRRATVARRKRNVFRKIHIKENCELSKELTADGLRKSPEGNNGIRRWDVEEPLHPRKGRITPTVLEDRAENSGQDWEVCETVARSSGRPSDWSLGIKNSKSQAGHEGGWIGHCGEVDLLQNGKRNRAQPLQDLCPPLCVREIERKEKKFGWLW
jgi:hypothetical protein